MHPDPQTPHQRALDDATRALIRAKARQLAHRFRLPPTDVPDLEQDLALHVWTRLDHFDPNRQADHGAFVRMLVGHVAAVLATLPGPLRRVAEALKTRPVAAAARHLGLSRTALYRRLGDLRAAFAAAGLEIFCAPRADTRRASGVVLQGKATTARTSDVE